MGLRDKLIETWRGLGRPVEETVNEKGKLHYKPLSLDQFNEKYDNYNPWEVLGTVRDTIAEYCGLHHITPIDIARVGGLIFVAKAGIHKWVTERPKCMIFLPIYRGGTIVAGWARYFNTDITWMGHGFSDGNGALLYTTALPPWAFSPDDARAQKLPLVLVESAVDALRLNRLGWWGVGLGGHNITQKGREELARLPQQRIIILLDADAHTAAVALMQKILSFKKNVEIGLITKGGKCDPCDLADTELREVLLKPMNMFAKEANKSAADVAS